MKNIFNIARTETRRIFLSPLAWTVLAIVQVIMGYAFSNLLFGYLRDPGSGELGVSDHIAGSLYGFAVIILLLVMPLMSMRLFSEDRKSQNITLLFSSPVSLTEIVLGKYLGLMGFVLAVLALMTLMPAALSFSTTLDWGRIAAGVLGLFLLMSAFGAAGIFVSSLTKEPTIAAVGTFGLLLMIWLLSVLSANDSMPFKELWSYLSLIDHYDSLRRGIFSSADVAYYGLFTTLFLWLTVQRLDMERN